MNIHSELVNDTDRLSKQEQKLLDIFHEFHRYERKITNMRISIKKAVDLIVDARVRLKNKRHNQADICLENAQEYLWKIL